MNTELNEWAARFMGWERKIFTDLESDDTSEGWATADGYWCPEAEDWNPAEDRNHLAMVLEKVNQMGADHLQVITEKAERGHGYILLTPPDTILQVIREVVGK